MVVGDEVGKEGTPHFQGYVEFVKPKRLTAVKKILQRAHWEGRKGTAQQAADYCKKDGKFHEDGTLSITGAVSTKKNWDLAKELARADRVEEIESAIYVPFYNTLKRIATDHAPKVESIATKHHEWHSGPTGTGKSRYVREKYPDAFIKDADRWWDGYRGEETVIIEDIDKYDVKLGRYIKLWGDHYAFPADMKCQGKRDIRPKRVIITSNYTPEEIWNDARTYEPIKRRYTPIEY